MITGLVRIASAVLLVFPFLVLIFYFDQWTWSSSAEILSALRFSFTQAGLSAIFTLILAFGGALGLMYWQRYSKILRLFFLLPNFVPPLFVMITAFQILKPFPFGTVGIVIVNSCINIGLASVILHSLLLQKTSGWSELALVEGSSRGQFLLVVLKYLKRDLLYVGFFIFCVCFASLSIPLLAGRFDVASLELLIFEKITMGENWGEVLGLAALQSLIVFVLGWSLRLPESSIQATHANVDLLKWRWGILPPLLITLLLVGELLLSAPAGWVQLENVGWEALGFSSALWQSLSIGLLVGALVFLAGGAICFALPHKNFEKFLNAYTAPSAALTAFSFLLLDSEHSLIFTSLALVCLFLPIVFRLNVTSSFRGLLSQIEVAKVLGAGPSQIFWQITLPNVARALGVAAGLASFWALGDFVVSGVLMGDGPSLAMLGKRLLESYRVEAASSFVVILLGLGSAIYVIFWSVGYVLSEKPIPRL